MKLESLSNLLNQLDYSSGLSGMKNVSAKKSATPAKTDQELALEKYQDAQKQNTETTFKVWDKHNDMVEKSAKLRQKRDRREAVERRAREHDEAEEELRAKMAIENANRTALLEASAMERAAKDEADAA